MADKIFDNRELSWLKFNQRVLDESNDKSVPLLERLFFSSIYSSNLDEFFMVRVGSLHDQMLIDDEDRDGKTKMKPSEQLNAIFKRTSQLNAKHDEYFEELSNELKENGIKRINIKDLSKEDKDFVDSFFKYEVSPFLSPQIVDKRHPFPFLNGKEIYAVTRLTSKSNIVLGIVNTSGVFSRVLFLPGKKKIRYILVEDIILHNADKIFTNYKIEEKSLIRVTRNADIDVKEALFDQEMDFRGAMSELIKKRKKLCAVRVQLSRELSSSTISELSNRIDIHKKQFFIEKSPLDMSYVFTIKNKAKDRKELFFKEQIPQKSPMVDESDSMISQIDKKDIFLSYPYESIKPFIKLLKEAAHDKNVASIKITLYRVAKSSKIVEALIDAAENGKDVLVLVELRARFDEENNIDWSKRLEDAGVKVIYGPEDLKVHSKLLLITRKFGHKAKYTVQIGTGNYNEKTAELYTDVCLMTSHQGIAEDALNVFNSLATNNLVEKTNHLLVAPKALRPQLIDMMDEEIQKAKNGQEAYIGVKANSLTDKVLIKKLIECSKAGVEIELVIRGICCLIPGIEGETENIKVVSIVGRYLEHARFYIFGKNDTKKIYISSADFMTRNTIRRVEVAVPIYDAQIRERIFKYFKTQINDNVKGRILQSNGDYKKQKQDDYDTIDAQQIFFDEAYKNAPVSPITSSVINKKPSLFKRFVSLFRKK